VRLDSGTGHAESLTLAELGNPESDEETSIYLPPLAPNDDVRTFDGMMNLARTLRAPGGCPWDREQTHTSLTPYLIEEAYEVLDAVDGGDPAQIREELGDASGVGEDADRPLPDLVEDLHPARSSARASRTPRTASTRLATTPRSAVRLY